jgi:hypothetical protein
VVHVPRSRSSRCGPGARADGRALAYVPAPALSVHARIFVLSLLGRKLDDPCAATPASHPMKFTDMV